MKIFYCANCNSWFSGKEEEATCPNCKKRLSYVDIDYEVRNI